VERVRDIAERSDSYAKSVTVPLASRKCCILSCMDIIAVSRCDGMPFSLTKKLDIPVTKRTLPLRRLTALSNASARPRIYSRYSRVKGERRSETRLMSNPRNVNKRIKTNSHVGPSRSSSDASWYCYHIHCSLNTTASHHYTLDARINNTTTTSTERCTRSHDGKCAASLAGRANACPSSTRTSKRSSTLALPRRRRSVDVVMGQRAG
jgi:hypothetical protein